MASAMMKNFKKKLLNNKINTKDEKLHNDRRILFIKSDKKEYAVSIKSDKYVNENELRFILDDLTRQGIQKDKEFDLFETCDILMKVKYLGSKMINGCMMEKFSVVY